jgi:hypothetical protein
MTNVSGNQSLLAMQRFFNSDLSLDVMLQRIHQIIEKLPDFMAKIILLCLVGLRPAEVVWNLSG